MQALTFVFAFVAVLALIGAAAWLVRRFAGNRLGANANRGRMPRLAVIDAAAVDGRRRLVLVRRDNVEHLLMIGGPTDIVVEPNIVRASSSRDQPRASVGTELPRVAPLADSPNWAEGDGSIDHPEPYLPEPPQRPVRPVFGDEGRRPAPVALSERRAESLERRADPMGRVDSPERRADPIGRGDSITGFVPESLQRPEPRPEPRIVEPAPARVARSEPPPMPRAPLRPVEPPPARTAPMRLQERAAAPPPLPPVQPAPVANISADQNLADMAQRLEAALRRPPSETRSDAAEPRLGVLPVAPEPPPIRPAPRASNEGSIAGAPRNEPPAPPPLKTGFENLEDEMASLLGRPKTSSS
jgi:flagellar protein FliO/FliZ